MLPPSSDPAAIVPTCPCPSALCIAPSTFQGQGDPRNQDRKGGAVLTSQRSSQRERRWALWIRTGTPREVSHSEAGQGTGAGRWGTGRSSACWHLVSGLENRRIKGKTLPAMRELWSVEAAPSQRVAVRREVPASTGRVFPPVDLRVADVLWAFPYGAYSHPHWRSQGRR